jgi:methionine-rich copper-binding protein CopC
MTPHSHPIHRPSFSLLSAILLAVVALVSSIPVPVSAHALMVRSDPEDGQVLAESPELVSAWFSQELDTRTSSMRVFDSADRQVDNGDGAVDLTDLEHKLIIVSLPPSLPDDTYTVRWSVVSAEDDDASQGEFTFVVGSGAVAGEPASQSSSSNSGIIIAGIAIGLILIVAVIILLMRRQKAAQADE